MSIVRVIGDIKRGLRDSESTLLTIVILYKAIVFFCFIVPAVFICSLVIGLVYLANPFKVTDELIDSLF